jgi:hypothetical protein
MHRHVERSRDMAGHRTLLYSIFQRLLYTYYLSEIALKHKKIRDSHIKIK